MRGRSSASLWTMTGTAAPDYRLSPLPARVDTVVIGGGFTGLTAARTVASAGRTVAVLEAGRIGAGASGANAGFVVPNFAKADPQAVRRRLGGKADALLNLVGTGADRLFSIIAEENIACDAAQTGWLQPAYGAEAAAMLQRRAADWCALGRPVDYLDAAAVATETGMDIYAGGLIDRSGGTIHPLNYAYGLAAAVVRAGGLIREESPVGDVRRTGTGWEVHFPGGTVIADTVLLCTNAFTSGTAARLGRTVVPLRVYQVATRPLDPQTVRRIAPHRLPVGDTRLNLFTYRLDRDDRLISGGMAILPFGAFARVGRAVAERLARELRLPGPVEVETVWTGVAAMTPDFLPRICRFGEGFYGGIGCNGRGIAMTAQLGGELGRIALGHAAEESPVPLLKPRPLPFHAFTPLVASAALAEARFRDWRSR